MSVRKKYAKEFKLDAVSLVLDQGYTQAKAGRSLGLNSNMLGRWIREYQSGDGRAFRGNGALTPEQEEIRKLKTHAEGVNLIWTVNSKITSISHNQRP